MLQQLSDRAQSNPRPAAACTATGAMTTTCECPGLPDAMVAVRVGLPFSPHAAGRRHGGLEGPLPLSRALHLQALHNGHMKVGPSDVGSCVLAYVSVCFELLRPHSGPTPDEWRPCRQPVSPAQSGRRLSTETDAPGGEEEVALYSSLFPARSALCLALCRASCFLFALLPV